MLTTNKNCRGMWRIFLLSLGMLALPAQAFYNSHSPLGTNTNEIMDDDSSVPFVDLMKIAVPFREARHLTKGEVLYDRYGWPRRISPGGQAGTRFVSKLPAGTIPAGPYLVLYDGEGKLEYGNDAKALERSPGREVILLSPGREVILLEPGSDKEFNATLLIKETNPNNPIRNIRILPPGGICASNPFQRVASPAQCRQGDYLSFEQHAGKIIFNPDYLNYMKDFRVIRFMNMSGITRNPVYAWEDRASIDQQTWGGAEGIRGAPMEVMVELANRLHADPWFSMPHAASDDFIRRFAEYVREHLDPSLKVYVEYTNEAWNGVFNQHAYMRQQGQRLGLDPDPTRAAWKYYSKRSVQVFNIWEQVFQGDGRVVRVMAGLTGSTQLTETVLGFEDAFRHTDAYAIAPYVYGEQEALRHARSVAEIFRIMADPKYPHSLPRVLESVRKQADITRRFGVDLIAYEGGQHLVDMHTKTDTEHPNPLFYAANRHPQMAMIYRDLLQGWKQAGGKLFVHFSSPRLYRKYGSFGSREYITQPDAQAPKHQALIAFARANPCWWQGCSGNAFVRQVKPTATLEVMKNQSEPLDKGYVADTIKNAPNQEQFAPNGEGLARTVRDPFDKWAGATTYQLRNLVQGQVDGTSDLAAWWQAAWDKQHLYLRVAVEDDQAFMQDSSTWWDDDTLELFIDADGSRLGQYDRQNDFHLIFNLRDNKVTLGENSPPNGRLALRQQVLRSAKGYVLEIAIPWQALQVQPSPGSLLGLDVHVSDDDDGGTRDGKLVWRATQDEAWRNPSILAPIVLE